VITIGRTDPTKGIDILIHAVGPLREEVHVVIIAVPFDGDDPLVADYARRIAAEGLRATLVTTYTRELRGWRKPARWSARRGESHWRMSHSRSPCGHGTLARSWWHHAGMGSWNRSAEVTRAGMRAAAYERVRSERDVVRNLTETLAFFWPSLGATGEAGQSGVC